MATKIEAERKRWNDAAAFVLAATRKDSDKSQQQLADMVGFSRAIIANVESGRKRIEASDLFMICRALKVEPERVVRRIMDRVQRW